MSIRPGTIQPLAARNLPETLAVTIRVCAESDLPALEWEGMFAEHREIILDAFLRQQQQSNMMLVAESRGRIVGQIWIDLTKLAARGTGLFWSLRVHPSVRGRGIGTELIGAAETWLAGHAFEAGAIGVEKENLPALRLCRRLGYDVAGELLERYTYSAPGGASHEVTVDLWLLQKRLLTAGVRQ